MTTQQQVRLAARPADGALPKFDFTSDPSRDLQDGEVKVELEYISLDPAMMGWTTDKRSYIAPVGIGEVMRAFGVGKVIESKSDYFKVGDYGTGFLGAQTESIVNSRELMKVDPSLAPVQYFLSGFGMTGCTAYFGLLDIGKPKDTDTVVVSSAAGAVGSIATQLAKQHARHVVGIAGGPEKCAFVKKELGADAVIDYKAGDIDAQLRAAAPDGIDVYFDNVGGEILDAVLGQINRHARIIVCGGVSQYGDMKNMQGPKNYMALTTHSGIMQGFTMRDYMRRVPEAIGELFTLHAAGKLKFREHILEGLEQLPAGLELLLRGGNQGKLLIKVAG